MKTRKSKDREFACILAPALPLQALVRSEPDLAGRPVAILDGHGTRAVLTHVSLAAREAGAQPGMTPSQARSIAPELVLRTVSPGVVEAAHRALTDVALAWSPRVQAIQPGVVVLDITGTRRRVHSRPAFGCALQAACRKGDMKVRVAVASGPRIALIAARSGKGMVVLPRGRESATLAPLSVQALAPSPALRETLSRLGVRTVGGFASINGKGLGIRLGPEAMDLHRLAHGVDTSTLHPMRPSEVFEESVSLDYHLDNAEPLLFLLSSALERLSTRLDARLMAPAGLHLSMELDPEGGHDLSISPPAPTSDVRSLVALVRLALESSPPPGPVIGFRVRADVGHVVASQGHMFGPPMPHPSQLAHLLGRLSALAGPDNVGAPAVMDGHARDPSTVARFEPRALAAPVQNRTDTQGSPETQPTSMAFRRMTPPLRVRIRTHNGVPIRLDGEGLAARITRTAGPWYAEADWWTGQTQAGAFHDAELADRGLFRLWHDLVSDHWFIDGSYD